MERVAEMIGAKTRVRNPFMQLERPWEQSALERLRSKRKRKPLAAYTPEEQAVIRALERGRKRKLTAQEVHLALGQARHIGTLEEPE
jgi:hypothetical protein